MNKKLFLVRVMGALVAGSLSHLAMASSIPLFDSQPRAEDSCPISITDSTETADGSVGVRHYGCEAYGTNVVYTVAIPPGCEMGGCGLIYDNHGATMNAAQQNAGTHLREFGWAATERGAATPYVVIQPNLTDLFDEGGLDPNSVAGGAYSKELPNILYFVDHVIAVLNIDRDRSHMYGFSRGSSTASAIYCDATNRNLFASYAVGGGGIDCDLDAPLLILNGIKDPGKMSLNNELEDSVEAMPGYQKTVIVNDPDWSRPTWEFSWGSGFKKRGNHRHIRLQAGSVMLESIKHSGTAFPAAGHCHPVTEYDSWLNCYTNMDTGAKVVDFFIQNPR